MPSVLLLTEDSAADAVGALRALVRASVRLVDSAARTPDGWFRPVEDPQVRQVTHANRWKSTRPQDDEPKRLLLRTITTELLKPAGFVVFHVDGDTTWSKARESENAAKFEKEVRRRVRRALEGQLVGDRSSEVEPRMGRLFLWMPHWSIESWLYQSTASAAQACRERGCGRHVELIESWGADRRLLDEVRQPKEAVCFAGTRNLNLALARAFPAADVAATGQSFHASLEPMRACRAWIDALSATHPA